MASREEVIFAMKALRASYPRHFTLGDESLDVWVTMLKDMPDGRLPKAIEKIVKNDEWPPSIARIREAGGWMEHFGWTVEKREQREYTALEPPKEVLEKLGIGGIGKLDSRTDP